MIKKTSNILWVVLFALPVFLQAQSNKELSEKNQKKFDYYFFEAEKYKQIERFDIALEGYLKCYDIDETNATIAFEIGRTYLKLGNATEALPYLEKAYELDANNRWITLELADFYTATKDYEKATPLFIELTKNYPSKIEYKFELAQNLFAQKRYLECIDVLNEVEALTGISSDLSRQKKDIYLVLDDADNAQKELEALANAYPNNLEYKGVLAQFYTANNQEEKAIAVYRQMLKQAPNDPRAHLDLAIIYQNQEVYDSSYNHLKVAMASPDLEVPKKIQVLYSVFQLGQKDTAFKKMGYDLLKLCIQATPNEAVLYALQAEIQLNNNEILAGRNSLKKTTQLGLNKLQIWSELLLLDAQLELNDSLVTDATLFIELYPNQPLGYLMAGSANLQLENYQNAIDDLEAGLDFVIDNPELEFQFYITIADAYHRLNDNLKSDNYFDKALEIKPNDPGTLNNYAYYLSVRGVRLKEALQMAEKCNNLAPNNGIFLDTWAWALYKNGKYVLALEKIELCAQYGGADSGEVLEHWGDILFKLNKIPEAVEKWKQAASKQDASENIQKKIETQQLYE